MSRAATGSSVLPMDPDRRLALNYVWPDVRNAVAALFVLDERLAEAAARASEPTIALMRLVWWRDALAALDHAPPPGEPLLQACALLPGLGVSGEELAGLVGGWDVVVEDPAFDDATIGAVAEARGERLFGLAARLIGDTGDDLVAPAGAGWALADLARGQSPATAARLRDAAAGWLDQAMARRWPRRLRALGLIAAIARDDLRSGPLSTRARAWRAMRHQITGR